MKTLIAVCALFFSMSVAAQERYLVDWDTVGEETLQHLSELVKINTSNPPGNETRAAEYFKAVPVEDLSSEELSRFAQFNVHIRCELWCGRTV